MSEPVAAVKRSVALIQERIDAVKDDQWDDPTPCSEWTVRDLVGHVIGGGRLLTSELTGQPTPAFDPAMKPGVLASGDAKATVQQVVAGFHAALDTHGALERTVNMPFGAVPAPMAITIIAYDVLVHTWDLSRAIGFDEKLPADAVQEAYDGLLPLDGMLRAPGVFGAAIDVPPDADLQTRFLAFAGRRI